MQGGSAIHRRVRARAALAVCVMAVAAGCAQQRAASSRDQPSGPNADRDVAVTGALRRLIARADDETRRPWKDGASAPPAPGIEAGVTEPIGAESRDKALAPFAAVVESLVSERPEGVYSGDPADPEAAETALRLYISGRQKSIEGNTAGALEDLRTATTLDPSAGEPWRELGEAQLLSGARAEATASLEKAASRGLNDPRVLELLGRWSLERGESRTAGIYLARAAAASPEKADPLLPQVVDVALWRALAAQGYLTAGRDVLLRACERPAQLSSSTRYGSEAGAIFRRQGDLWREVGDADCRLGQFPAAADAYQRADALPSIEGKDSTPRLVFAMVRTGRPAGAAVSVLRDIMQSGGRAGASEVDLLRYLAKTAGLSEEISGAIEAFRRALPQPSSVAGGLARAQAAVAAKDHAAAVLREQLHRHPADLRSATALFDVVADPAEVAREAAARADDHPDDAGRLAEAILRSSAAVEPVLDALARATPRDAATLVLAYLHGARGDSGAAADAVASLRAGGRIAPAVALAQVELGLLAGRADLAARGQSRLAQGAGKGWARYKARALAWAQRGKPALEALEIALQDHEIDDERMDDLILAGELGAAVGRAEDAERWFREAAALDPYDDRPASRLLTLHGPAGARPDPAKVTQVVRELRQAMPDSKPLRAARAKELQRRSLLAQAEQEAAALAGEDPSDGALIDLLTGVWRARSEAGDKEAIGRGRKWLEARLVRRPRSPVLLAGLTTLLVASGDADQAATRLRGALDAGGSPEVSRLLERVMRNELGRSAEADALTLRRLEGRDLSIGEAVELADLYLRQDHDVQAAMAASRGITAEATVTPEQGTRLLTLASQIAQRAVDASDQGRLAAAAGLFDLAASHGVKFSGEVHERRLAALAVWTGADAKRILDAAGQMAADFPARASAVYIGASQLLTQAKRGPMALEVIGRAADLVKDPGVDVLTEWLRIVFTSGTVQDARVLIDRAARDGKVAELAKRAGHDGPAPKEWRAELAYVLGNLFAAEQRPQESNQLYELALEYDPDHAWACNNLGYALADKGQQVERASTLLEKAHAALPGEAAVTDSLGWLRYKQGIILDEADATGEVKKQGAVSLLQSAAATDRGKRDPTIMDHLGDALWLAGRRQDALVQWQQTEQLAAGLVADASRAGRPQTLSSAAIQEYRSIKDSAGSKRRAAVAGEDVRVAPQLSEPNPRPIAAPASDDAGAGQVKSGHDGGDHQTARPGRGRTQ